MDIDTFTNDEIINFSKAHFINVKINTDEDDGFDVFKKFHGVSLPTILFLDSKGNEIDRFMGYHDPVNYLKKINDVVNGVNTLEYFLALHRTHPDSSNLSLQIGNKYLERNVIDTAKIFFENVLNSTDKNNYQEANYQLAFLEYENSNLSPLLNFIDENPNSDFTYSGLRSIIRYYKGLSDTTSELKYYKKLVSFFPTDPSALNSYGWRMSELEMNLNDALEKTSLAVNLSIDDLDSKLNILDTQAEILWKLGQVQEAINIIEQAIQINPNNEYSKEQKNKFKQSL